MILDGGQFFDFVCKYLIRIDKTDGWREWGLVDIRQPDVFEHVRLILNNAVKFKKR